jgi:hypothetical protein
MAPNGEISCTSVVENEQPRGNMHIFLLDGSTRARIGSIPVETAHVEKR